jgi:hypothetical protein
MEDGKDNAMLSEPLTQFTYITRNIFLGLWETRQNLLSLKDDHEISISKKEKIHCCLRPAGP